MGSIQIVLRKKSNAQGQYPLAIRITKNRKSSFIHTGQYIGQEYWDSSQHKVKRSHPNSKMINHFLLKKLAEANEKLLQSEISKNNESVKKIRKSIIGKEKEDFNAFASKYLDRLKNRKQYYQFKNEKGRLEKFMAFTKKNDLTFDEITPSLLKSFETYLINQRQVASRTAVNYMIPIRTIYNQAISDGVADQNKYPFGRGKYQIRFPESDKIGLNIRELQKLENASGLTSSQQHALNVWLMSFYFAGMRITDIIQLKWSDLTEGRLKYRMSKNDKLVSLKIPMKAKVILNMYKEFPTNENDVVFPELATVDLDNTKVLRTRIKTVTRNFNRHLKRIGKLVGIDKNLSMHIARHSFGNISGDKIPIQTLQKLYRHSSITTTMNYQANFISKNEDEALDKVVGF
ncbi:MAG: site-specific integrase [Bacteroidota bacterium]